MPNDVTRFSEHEEAKEWFVDKIKRLEKFKIRLEMEKDAVSRQSGEPLARAAWLADFVNITYDDMILLFQILSEVVNEMYESNTVVSKLDKEWKKRRATLNGLERAMDMTNKTLGQNR
jgi:hypothetical protein